MWANTFVCLVTTHIVSVIIIIQLISCVVNCVVNASRGHVGRIDFFHGPCVKSITVVTRLSVRNRHSSLDNVAHGALLRSKIIH